MAMSDASERTAEVWRDVPATEATLAQVMHMQQQMQQQMQLQTQQQMQVLQHVIQLQEDGIKQPQLPMPSMMWPQNPCWSLGEPSVRRGKVQARPGRLGKRERAELKARSSRSPEAEVSGDDSPWVEISKGASQTFATRLMELEERCGQQQAKLQSFAEERDKSEERTVAMDAKVETLIARMISLETAVAEMPATIEQKVSLLEGKLGRENSMMDSRLDGALAKVQSQVDSRNQESDKALQSMQLLLDEQAQKIQETQVSVSASSASAVDLSASVQSLVTKIDSLETAIAEVRSQQEERLSSLEAKLEHEIAKVNSKLEETFGKVEVQLYSCQEGCEQQIRANEVSASGTLSDFKNSLVAKLEQLEQRLEPAPSGVDAAVEASDWNDENTETSSLNPQEPAPAPAPHALKKAIAGRQSQVALDLLKLQEVPCLNDICQFGGSTLGWAIHKNLPEVALAIVQRPDFKQVNSKDWVYGCNGCTCLHYAAARGYLDVVQAILARSDFCELHAKLTSGWSPPIGNIPAGSTALDVARICRRHEVVRLIESRLREA